MKTSLSLMSLALWTTFALSLRAQAQSQELDLETWRQEVLKNNPEFRALELQEEASISLLEEAADLPLSPFLMVDAGRLDTQKPQSQPKLFGTQTLTKTFSLGVKKKFATGTDAKLLWGQNFEDVRGSDFPTTQPWTGTWGIEIQQSLWKDLFGRGTRARRARELAAQSTTHLSAQVDKQQKWMGAEEAYWNWVQKSAELQIRNDDLKRAEDLYRWMRGQVNRGLSTTSDLLQIEALQMSRQIQQQSSEDAWKSALEQMRIYNPNFKADQTLPPTQDKWKLAQNNRLKGLEKIRLDAKILEQNSAVALAQSEESLDALRADFNLVGHYYGNEREVNWDQASQIRYDDHKDTTYIGLEFRMNLDRSAVNQLSAAYRSQSQVAKIRADKAKTDGAQAWKELLRSYDVLQQRSELAEKLWQVQSRKAQRERELLQKGRSSTFQVVTFEQEQSEAQIMWLQTLMGLRKVEAQALFFDDVNLREGSPL